MKPVIFDEQTAVAGQNQKEFMPLPMYRNEREVISCWELTDEELQELIKTRKIWLRLQHPANDLITPSLLQVHTPFEQLPTTENNE